MPGWLILMFKLPPNASEFKRAYPAGEKNRVCLLRHFGFEYKIIHVNYVRSLLIKARLRVIAYRQDEIGANFRQDGIQTARQTGKILREVGKRLVVFARRK